jgi:hypothetical protein
MGVELKLQAFLGIGYAVQRGQRHFERSGTDRTDGNDRNGAQPFRYSKISFLCAHVFTVNLFADVLTTMSFPIC